MLGELIGGAYFHTSIEDFIKWFNVVKPLNENQKNINEFFDLLKRFDDNEFYKIDIMCGSGCLQDEDVRPNPECFFRIQCINKLFIKNASLEIENNKDSDNEKYLLLNYKKSNLNEIIKYAESLLTEKSIKKYERIRKQRQDKTDRLSKLMRTGWYHWWLKIKPFFFIHEVIKMKYKEPRDKYYEHSTKESLKFVREFNNKYENIKMTKEQEIELFFNESISNSYNTKDKRYYAHLEKNNKEKYKEMINEVNKFYYNKFIKSIPQFVKYIAAAIIGGYISTFFKN